jgi:signal transduction histidine kinase
MPLSLKETDLRTLLPHAVASLGPPPEGITVGFDLPESPVAVTCDPDLISRVVINLVGNAFKFTPPGSQVRVALVSEVDRVRFAVTDSGPGIPAEFRGKIFEKFGVRSSGLGLTVCKRAVEAHRGKIGMENADSGGARFWVELFRSFART